MLVMQRLNGPCRAEHPSFAGAQPDCRAALAALQGGDAAEAERLRRLTIASIRSAVERHSALFLVRDAWRTSEAADLRRARE